MPSRPDLIAARKALGKLRLIHGALGDLSIGGHSYTAHISSRLDSNPKSRTRLLWVWDSGYTRELWVKDRKSGKKHLYHLYFGPWGRPQVKSAYLVIFGPPTAPTPALEVRLSQAKPVASHEVSVQHRLPFRGRTYKNSAGMHRAALQLADGAGVPLADGKAVIGAFRISNGEILPSPKRFLWRAIVCALAKLLVIARAGASRTVAGGRGARLRKMKPRKKKRFTWKRGQLMQFGLDEKFHSQELHEALLSELQERLQAQGIEAAAEHPYDLVVAKGRRPIVVEMKAWRKGGIVAAAQAAAGQLLYYAYRFQRGNGTTPKLLLALWKKPSPDDVRFLAGSDIGVIWRSLQGWEGDSLAHALLPELVV